MFDLPHLYFALVLSAEHFSKSTERNIEEAPRMWQPIISRPTRAIASVLFHRPSSAYLSISMSVRLTVARSLEGHAYFEMLCEPRILLPLLILLVSSFHTVHYKGDFATGSRAWLEIALRADYYSTMCDMGLGQR